jgi:DNA-binding transcriptional MocR family regulator
MVSSGSLENHIRKTLIPCYSGRYYAMVDSIREHLVPLGVQINAGKPFFTTVMDDNDASLTKNDKSAQDRIETAGGFFLSITLPKDLPNTPVLAKIALEKYDLKFAYGKMFEVKGDGGSKERSSAGFGNTVRLCWAFHEVDAIMEGIKRMRDMLVEQRESVTTS